MTIKLLIGGAGQGKSRCAESMTYQSKQANTLEIITGNDSQDVKSVSRRLGLVRPKTQQILIDEVPFKQLPEIAMIFFNKNIIVNMSGKSASVHPCEIIIVCSCAYWQIQANSSLLHRVEVYTCAKNNDHETVIKRQ